MFSPEKIQNEFMGENGYRRWKEHQKLHRLVNFQVSINFFRRGQAISCFFWRQKDPPSGGDPSPGHEKDPCSPAAGSPKIQIFVDFF